MGLTARLALAGLALGVASANPMGNGTVYVTEVVNVLTTYCPAATTLTQGGKTYTVTEATTLTITDCPCTITRPSGPTTTGPVKDACAEGCMNVYNKCRTAKGANMSYCASQYADCLGFNPFGGDGSNKPVTACSQKPPAGTPPVKDIVYTTEVVTAITTYCPEPTTLVYNNRTVHVTQPGTVTVTDCPCTIRHPVPSSVPAPTCAEMCNDAYNKCRTAKGANMSYCASQYASCLGYNPFGNDGTFVTPTACHAGGNPPAGEPTKPAGQPPAQPTQPGQGGKPSTTGAPAGTPAPPVPAGAGRVAPAGVALALGALALL